MSTLCWISFHGDLKHFLPPDKDSGLIQVRLERRTSVKDLIEACGPPHTEIGELRVQDRPADFGHIVSPGETIEVQPHTPPVNPFQPTLLRPTALSGLRFVVDVNVGKLSPLLRMLGFDTAYHWTWRDRTIADMAESQGRIVLTRDLGLLKRKKIVWGRLIRGKTPEEQLPEVLDLFGLQGPFRLFSRCLNCNVLLEDVDKADIVDRLEPKTKLYFNHFRICPSCGRIFWRGSHHEKMIQFLTTVLGPFRMPGGMLSLERQDSGSYET
jgi:hypothetical protein